MNLKKQFMEGLITQNPVLVQVLGMCSTMAITTSFFNGLGMGVAVTVILTLSNVIISAIRKIVPDKIRIAMFIVVIAGFVTCVDLLIQAFVPALAESLGVFIPLIVVNCIILGRAESFSYKNGIAASFFDGIFQGIGYTVVLMVMCIIREFLGTGTFGGGLHSWLTASDRVRRQAVYNLYNKEEKRMFHFSNRHHHTGKTSMSRAKVYDLFMALAMLFMAGLCACSAQPHSAAETAPQTIVVGIDVFDPYSYLDRNGQFAGIDVELATEAFSRLGYTPEFRTISWPDKNNLLSDGTIDCIWSCFSMNGRETNYQWAGPYMYSRQVVAVRADSDIQSLSDLAGKRIGVQATTKAESLFLGEISSLLPEVKQVNSFETTEDMFAALRKGYVDAVAGHEALVAKWTNLDESGYRVLSESPYSSELGVAFAKDTHEDLAVQLTQTLEDMKQDGTIGRVAEKFGLDAEKTVWGEQGK